LVHGLEKTLKIIVATAEGDTASRAVYLTVAVLCALYST
jgi:hypothetical protein